MSSKRIGLAEDYDPMRQTEEMLLTSMGHEVKDFEDGSLAWEYIKQHPDQVDLVITDIMMPIMGGDELIENIKNNPTTKHIRIAVQSGECNNLHLYLDKGVKAYMAKPYSRDNIKKLLQEALS